MNRRRFLYCLGLSPALMSCHRPLDADFYAEPDFGNVTLLHITDCHAQLLPGYCREPSVKIGAGPGKALPAYLTGQPFLDAFGIPAHSRDAYALTHLNFAEAARKYGKTGGFAHLSSLIKEIRNRRGHENTLLLDGGDSWQGSATALWTGGRDMISACNLLGVDIMTGHWEFTYGSARVLDNIRLFRGEFLAQNISFTDEARFANDSNTPYVFKPYTIREFGKARVAVIGQAFPYIPIAHPRRFFPDWQCGIEEQNLRKIVAQIKKRRLADAIVLLSHNGLDADLKLASRVCGLDAILGGHTHDAIPRPVPVDNAEGRTWVTNAGSHGKFLGVLDLDISQGRVRDLRYRLLPVFADLIEPDAEMQSLIDNIRAPYLSRLQRPLAASDQLLYRRDTYCGTFDELILAALRGFHDAEISLSPGFRWGTALLPGQTVTYEDVMNHTAITYSGTYVKTLSGNEIKSILEDVADNLFNRDPYYRQGGDMVRTGGMSFHCSPEKDMGQRIGQMRLANGNLIDPGKHYRVAGWAGMGAQADGKPAGEVVADYLTSRA